MNLNRRHQYAVSAMVQMALHSNDVPMQMKTISEQGGIPHSFLEQLVLDLKKSGLIVSTRGAKGGYRLAKSPDAILIQDIINAIDPVVSSDLKDPFLSFFWNGFVDHANEYFKQPLSELVTSVLNRKSVLNYNI